MEELLKSLIYIQQNLNAPKNQFNNYGKYNYRSLEDIEAALKPLLAQQNCGIRFQDEVVEHAGRTFLKTTLIFFNTKGASLSTTAEAEHSIDKAGMDSAQITGAASSYARKYAMNALFAIDDSKDADTNEYHNQTQKKPTTTRKSSASTQRVQQPQYSQAQSNRYQAITSAINNCQTVEALTGLYYQHIKEIQSDPNILSLFTERKNKLNSAA